ncbi:MAG: FHA domain-containing protein [Leptolyngbyaceae cyanobacterium SU_3_3]|nr:FHA domain-containing protein [Leptolyngbyaceae cyanobacterium SU_3_3]NJR51520.1 FHA domain-containing protein [Leptolyngbyaceae cyanobacterium CSU_1_3]
MKPKSNPTENRISSMDETAMIPSLPLKLESCEEVFWEEEVDESIEDSGFTKAQTLMLDLEAEDEIDLSEPPPRDLKPRYVQGILQGTQVYLITNLLHDKSQTLIQSQKVWTIGRNRSAALPLQDRKMSRRHAVILYGADHEFYLLDLNSLNGSYVNGVRVIQRQQLRDGDRVCLGHTEFSFYVSQRERTVDLIHPEVLTRLNNFESRTRSLISYADEGIEE